MKPEFTLWVSGRVNKAESMSVRLAAQKAKEFNHHLTGSLMGTDSFFPFPDGLEAAVEAGAKAIINPGAQIMMKM